MNESKKTDRLRTRLAAEREDFAFHRKILRRMRKPEQAPIEQPAGLLPDKRDLQAKHPSPREN